MTHWKKRTLPPPLVGTWIPCPTCKAWRCETCPGTSNFSPVDPPTLHTLSTEDLASVVDLLMGGGTEMTFYGCRVELYPSTMSRSLPLTMQDAYTHLVDRRDGNPIIVSTHDGIGWREVLLEAKRRG